mgnify:FL=1
MLASGDKRSSDEPKSARVELRTQPSVKDTISRAAALNGVDVSAYVISAALEAAKATLAAHDVTVLASAADSTAFFAALDNPPQPSERLAKAFALREKLIANAD